MPRAGNVPGVRGVCDAGAVTRPRPARQLLPLPGGTRPQDVARLRQALARAVAEPGRGPLLLPLAPGEEQDGLLERAHDAIARRPDLAGRADLLLRTSGSSSGDASLIAMSAGALVASARATHARLGGPGTWVLALPAHHVAGLQVLLRGIVAGTRPRVLDTSAGFDPEGLADLLESALGEDPGTPLYLSLVPTQLRRCLDIPCARRALARTTAVLVGGAATEAHLSERARTAGVPVVTTYGMSETGGGCVYDGVALDGVGVRIEQPDAQGVGRIVLTGPVLAEGYLLAAGSTTSFRPATAGGPPAVLTADRGRLTDGRLHVLGRADDVIITGGVKVEPRQVEEALARLEGVAEACVVGVPDEQWGSAVAALVVPRAGAGLEPEAVRAAVRAVLDGAHTPKHVLVVEELALCGPGKVDRRAAGRLARERLR